MKLKNEHIHPMFLLAAAAIALTIANVHAGPILAGPLAANDSRLVLANGASIVSGGVEVDTTAAEGEYHEYLCSLPDKIKLESGKTYRLSYDYTVNKVGGDNTEFYHIFRTGVNYDLDKNEFWSAAVGSKGHKEFTVKLDGADYKFILGVRFKGAIRIENLRLEEVAASALTREFRFHFLASKMPGLSSKKARLSSLVALRWTPLHRTMNGMSIFSLYPHLCHSSPEKPTPFPMTTQ